MTRASFTQGGTNWDDALHDATAVAQAKDDGDPTYYIFVSDEFEIVESHVVTDPIDGRYPSDHYPLEATLRLRTEARTCTA